MSEAAVCQRCAAPIREDRLFAMDARGFAPGIIIRQWRCLNGHSITLNTSPTPRPVRLSTYTCDICGLPGQARDRQTRRHPECRLVFQRDRMRGWRRRASLALT